MTEFVEDEVGDGFGNTWLFKWRHPKGSFDLRFRHFQDASPQEFEEKEVYLLRVGVFLL